MAVEVNVHEAKTHFSKFLQRVMGLDQGEVRTIIAHPYASLWGIVDNEDPSGAPAAARPGPLASPWATPCGWAWPGWALSLPCR